MRQLLLTSSEVRQNQQNTCLHLLHIIWAHPASLSMGTWHIGHLLMFSLPSIISRASLVLGWPSVMPCITSRLPFSWHVASGCQLEEQAEQNSFSHFGQITAAGSSFVCCELVGTVESPELAQMWHIVLQPGFGHQALLESKATSVIKKEN